MRGTACALGFAAALVSAAWAQQPSPTPDAKAPAAGQDLPPPVVNSSLDAPLLYQLLIGEMEAQQGRRDAAFEIILDAARRTRNEDLFQRSVELALQMRSGDKALIAARAWRTAHKDSITALRLHVQVLVALDRPAELEEPLQALLTATPPNERAAAIAGLPRLLSTATDKVTALRVLDKTLAPYMLDTDVTRAAAMVALGRASLAAGGRSGALELARKAQEVDPGALGPALLALELMSASPPVEAEDVIEKYLARPDAVLVVHLAYVRALDGMQRLGDATKHLRIVVARFPDSPQALLTLGAHLVELREAREGQQVLTTYLAKAQARAGSPSSSETDLDEVATSQDAIESAWMLLSQAASQLGDDAAAEAWIERIEPANVDLQVLNRKALLMAKRGKVAEARTLLRTAPLRDAVDARARTLAEVQLLREVKMWREGFDLLAGLLAESPQDTGVLYEQATMAEKLNRYDEMEALLRQIIAIKPDYHHAYNALGYSLAERNLRLEEARGLVKRAAELAPGDPFVTDSLGWVEFRLGNRTEAVRLLRLAHDARPDTEIAAHLGEVLWVNGQRDDALKIWRDGKARDANNEVLRETLARLKVGL